ncbi:MAG: hypothetical protein HY018_12655 [Hydrogenophilales bacterium]|nr:hypothetical protein [Hydrogenophilales bacterium]
MNSFGGVMGKSLITIAAVLLCSTSFAGEPIGNIEQFEHDVTQCISNAPKSSGCFEDFANKNLLPGNEKLIQVTKQVDGLFGRWLDKDKVFAIHPVSVKSTGDLFQRRTYVIEDTSGNLIVFNYSIIKRLGKWYLLSFDINSNQAVVEATVKGDK